MSAELRRRTSPTVIDQRRLRDGARALALAEPKTKNEIENQIHILHAGLVALQSMDDLGSDRANRAAHDNMTTLEAKYLRLKAKLKEF